jgi:hypothetical protein
LRTPRKASRSCWTGLKALLEHHIRLNLTPDRYPKGIEEQVIGQ